jgi:hypothetical protein
MVQPAPIGPSCEGTERISEKVTWSAHSNPSACEFQKESLKKGSEELTQSQFWTGGEALRAGAPSSLLRGLMRRGTKGFTAGDPN